MRPLTFLIGNADKELVERAKELGLGSYVGGAGDDGQWFVDVAACAENCFKIDFLMGGIFDSVLYEGMSLKEAIILLKEKDANTSLDEFIGMLTATIAAKVLEELSHAYGGYQHSAEYKDSVGGTKIKTYLLTNERRNSEKLFKELASI